MSELRSTAVSCDNCVVPRLLIVPGLNDSGPMHWQSWMQRRHRSSLRAAVTDWSRADLGRWSDDIAATLAAQPPGPWIAVAHSFGCLAVLRALQRHPPARPGHAGVFAALLVAPASPQRHGSEALLRQRMGDVDLLVVSSSNDPWLPTDAALPWAATWGARLHDLGPAGHINAEAGFGPWPWAQDRVVQMRQRWHARRHAESEAAPKPTPYAHAA